MNRLEGQNLFYEVFESNDVNREDYITQNFLNPLKMANKRHKKRGIDFNTMMNIEDSQDLQTVHYRPRYTDQASHDDFDF